MAQWQNFCQQEFEPEILVGLYEQWLACIGFGPTQAVRALQHTDIMEIADERRFAISQSGGDMSTFEREHPKRIAYAIENFVGRYMKHGSTVERFVEREDDVAPMGTQPTAPPIELCGLPELDIFPINISMEIVLAEDDTSLYYETSTRPSINFVTDVSEPSTADHLPTIEHQEQISVDDKSEGSIDQETMALLEAYKSSRKSNFDHPRKLGHVRVRHPASDKVICAGVSKAKSKAKKS